MASGASLKSHMTEISKTMLQLAQAHERIANTQQSNHQTMVNVQQQQANALSATTQQQKYDAMFAAVPRLIPSNISRAQLEIVATEQVRRRCHHHHSWDR